jgi:hypothetical protein
MDEENDELTVPGLDFAQLSDPTKLLGMVQSTYDRQLEALNRSETNAKARFDAAEARIRERNRGPSQSEQLFMLSKALLAPRDYRGFGGTIGKISGAFSNIADADEKSREQRDAQLAALQDAYAAQGDAFGVTRAKTAADTLKTAVPLFKKPARSTTSPINVGPDLVPRSRNYGTTIKEPPQPAIYELQAYLANPSASAQDKITARRNFDTRFGYGAAEIFGGEQ